MNAYEIPGLRFSLPASGAIKRNRFVTVNSNSAGAYASAGSTAIGVSMNEVYDAEALEISDGIVMVEAGDTIAAGADIEVGVDGKAVTKADGVGVAISLTAAAAGDGELVAVKLVSVSAINGSDVVTLKYTAADLVAGADLSDVIIGAVGSAGTITGAQVISAGSAAGVDGTNTSVFAVKVAGATVASGTFDATTAFPAAGVATDLAITTAGLAAGAAVLLDVTNGATANLPIFVVQLTVTLDA